MDLEEHTGVEQVKDHCESCGARLTAAEVETALEGSSDTFLCSRCAAEQVPLDEEPDDA